MLVHKNPQAEKMATSLSHSARFKRDKDAKQPTLPKVKVISPAGERGTNQVAFFRLLTALGVGATLVAVAYFLGELVTKGAQAAARELTIINVGLISLAILLAGLSAFLEIRMGSYAARAEERRIRASLLQSLYESPQMAVREGGQFSPGYLVALMTDNAERLTEFRQAYWGSTKAAFLIPFLALTYVAIAIDWVIGLSLILIFPLVPAAVYGFMQLFRKRSKVSRQARAKLAAKYLDAIRNLVTIRLLGAGARIEQDLEIEGERNRGTIMRLLAGNQIVIIILDGAVSLFLICFTVYLTFQRLEVGAVTLGQAFAVVLLIVLVMEPIQQVSGFFYIGMGGMAAMRAIRRYLAMHGETAGIEHGAVANSKHDVVASDTAAVGAAEKINTVGSVDAAIDLSAQVSDENNVSDVGSSEDVQKAAIVITDLHHDYGRHPVLQGVNLTVPTGAKVAIIGESGGGKSTLLSLLRGQLSLQSGTLTLAGKNFTATSAQLAQIRAASAAVAQKTWLFSGTIADNLRIANPNATEAQMWEALSKAYLAQDVKAMPQQLNTDVGERGSFLSGGQAQRLSLARAFISGRKILVLDEPTSQVDKSSEAQIIKAIAEIDSQYTVLLVTHRKSLLDTMDAVYRLENGVLISVDKAEA